MKKCSFCGTENQDNSVFCELCGRRFKTEPEEMVDETIIVNEEESESDTAVVNEVIETEKVQETKQTDYPVNTENTNRYYSDPVQSNSQQDVFADYKRRSNNNLLIIILFAIVAVIAVIVIATTSGKDSSHSKPSYNNQSNSTVTQTPQNQNSSQNQTNSGIQTNTVPTPVPNDGSSVSKAITLSPNTSVYGSLESKDDVLWYVLTLDKPGTVTFNMQYPSQSDSSCYWKLYVYTTGDTSSSIMSSAYYGNDENSDSQLLGLDAGTYYVKITPYYHSSSAYTLTPVYTETALCEMEPNDGYGTASVLSVNQPHVGCLYSDDDVDWYVLTLDKPGTVTFNMQYPSQDDSSCYWKLYVYTTSDSSSSIMSSAYYGQAAGFDSTVNSDSQLLGLDAGTYYVKITPYYHSSSAYTLTPVYTETALCEMEPNDGYGTASVLSVNQPHVGCLYSDDDVDWYVLTLDKPGTVTFNMQYPSQDDSSCYWKLYVYTSNSSSSSILNCSYYGNTTTTTENQIGLDAGTYYVKVVSYYHSSSPYTLTAIQ